MFYVKKKSDLNNTDQFFELKKKMRSKKFRLVFRFHKKFVKHCRFWNLRKRITINNHMLTKSLAT